MVVKFALIKKDADGKRLTSGKIRVTAHSFAHTNGCVPSPNQLNVAHRASGDYSKMKVMLVANILSIIENDPGTSTRSMRALLRVSFHFPNCKAISAKEFSIWIFQYES